MIKYLVPFLALVAACGAPVESDQSKDPTELSAQIEPRTPEPFKEEFLAACTARPEHVPAGFYSTERITPESFCECLFTTAMIGLTEDEKRAAAYFLLAQSGVDLSNRSEFRKGDPTAAIGGSEGVGRAVRRCGA